MFSIRNTVALAALATAMAVPMAAANAELIYGLSSSNRIVTFDSANPNAILSSGLISGLAMGDTLRGLDLRAANKTLYSVGSSGNVYAITGNSNGYTATSVGVLSNPLNGGNFGVDFNPVPDRLRLVSDTNNNLRVNVAGGAAIIDGSLTLNGTNRIDLIAASYTNNRAGATSTVLYGIDATTASLVRATNANAGTYVSTNLAGNPFLTLGLPIDDSDRVNFDISGGSRAAFLQFNNGFYTVDLSSGASTFIGNLGDTGLIGLTAAAVPEPASWAMLIAGFGLVGASMRRRRIQAVTA